MVVPLEREPEPSMSPPRAAQDTTPAHLDASKLSFPIQLLVLAITSVLTVAGTNWATRGDVRSLSEQQQRMAADLKDTREEVKAINGKLPNQEALNQRLAELDRRLAEMKQALEVEQQWRTKTREQLIKRGTIDP